MNLRRLACVCGVAIAIICLVPAPLPAQQQNATLSIPLFGDTTVEVDVDNGGARFLPAASTDNGGITIKSNASGPTPSQLPIQSTRSGKRIIVTLGRGSGSTQLPFVAKPQVAYDVIYPSRLKLIVHAFGGDIYVMNPTTAIAVSAASGDVLVENPHAPVSVDDQSGSVTVHRAVAALDLAADTGNVVADLDSAWLSRSIRMQSASGTLTLTVPQNFSAHVDASSQNGAVHSALSAAASGASGPPVWLFAEHGDVTIDFPKPKS